jgi:hypothetical protein
VKIMSLSFIIATMVGCASNSALETQTVTPPAVVTLAPGGSAAIATTSWTLRFDSVASDSRCPASADCIAAGEAVLAMHLTSPLVDPLPGTNGGFTLGTTPVTINGFTLTQVSVTPLRNIGETINPKSYRVRINVVGPAQPLSSAPGNAGG